MLGSSSDIRVRKGRPSDAKALAEVFRESWEHTYRGIIPHLHLETMIRRRGCDWWANALRSGDAVLLLEAGRRGRRLRHVGSRPHARPQRG